MQKVVWAGANNGSYPLAAVALRELAEIQVSAKQVRRLTTVVGDERLAERDQAVERLQAMPLPQRRAGSSAAQPPDLAIISMDGGRYQRRDNFGDTHARQKHQTHWRETKVGCLLSMRSEVHASDPTPRFPAWLATSAAVAELAKIADKTGLSASSETSAPAPSEEQLLYEPPELLARDVVASSDEAETFGWQLEARAWQLGFPAAKRQAFVADGQAVNWTLAGRHFPHATPIVDLMHALSYAWSAAMAVDQGASYRRWAESIWQGRVSEVIMALDEHRQRLGTPPSDADPADPRCRVQRAWTYYTNNQTRMNYPSYRQAGLPLTSSHIESTIKQMNLRVKGSEKFWNRTTGDAVLQLRADSLSDSQPLAPFWRRWQAQQTGENCYRAAA
jgi:hypothetical protein